MWLKLAPARSRDCRVVKSVATWCAPAGCSLRRPISGCRAKLKDYTGGKSALCALVKELRPERLRPAVTAAPGVVHLELARR
jgi:hypothetical protein